jgi:hypothetical protein
VKVIPTQTRIRAFRVITYFIFTEVWILCLLYSKHNSKFFINLDILNVSCWQSDSYNM